MSAEAPPASPAGREPSPSSPAAAVGHGSAPRSQTVWIMRRPVGSRPSPLLGRGARSAGSGGHDLYTVARPRLTQAAAPRPTRSLAAQARSPGKRRNTRLAPLASHSSPRAKLPLVSMVLPALKGLFACSAQSVPRRRELIDPGPSRHVTLFEYARFIGLCCGDCSDGWSRVVRRQSNANRARAFDPGLQRAPFRRCLGRARATIARRRPRWHWRRSICPERSSGRRTFARATTWIEGDRRGSRPVCHRRSAAQAVAAGSLAPPRSAPTRPRDGGRRGAIAHDFRRPRVPHAAALGCAV